MFSIFNTKDQFLGIVRHVVTFLAGLIIAKGNLDPTAMETIVGVGVGIAGLIWSVMAPEKALTAEKVAATLEPKKMAAIEAVMAKTEEKQPSVAASEAKR